VKFLFSRRGLAVVAVLVLILFLWRPGVYKLRSRIAGSIGSALGRRVELSNVSLHFLPRPGFDLEGLVIYDDPAFSAEPMIRAQQVSAAIRFSSLLRGRLEIARLSATEPSINLVRNHEGHWNLASLIERNAQIPAAPTGKPASEWRPAFPYLEASGARINFKLGQTKKSFALMDADVALWQDSENSWGARMKAEPVRTDFNLTDTGLIQIDATWQRAPSLKSTPLRIAMQWKNGQLGQITQLLSGEDRGWRGGLNVTAKISGTPEALQVESQTAIGDFRRYDIVGSESVRIDAACSGRYNAVTSTFADLLCKSPLSRGLISLRGIFVLTPQLPAYDLTLTVEKMPLNSMVRLLRQAKKQIPSDLTASGLLNAEFRAMRNRPPVTGDARHSLLPQWSGTGTATNVRLLSNAGKDEVAFGSIPLTLVGGHSQVLLPINKPGHPKNQQIEQEPTETHLRVGPVEVTTKAVAPVNAGGWLSAAGYSFYLRGDMELKNLFRLEDVLGLPMAHPAAEGDAKLDVNISGPWQRFVAPVTLGTAQLRNVHAEIHGLNPPIEIDSATMSLTTDAVSLQKISARIGSSHWSGEVTAPRQCAALSAAPNCEFQFDLAADQFSTGELTEWFTRHPAKRPWYRILNSNFDESQGTSPLLAIRAHGNLQVGRFGLKKMSATKVAAQVAVDGGKITLTGLRGQLLQGTYQGNWTINLLSRPALYQGGGALRNIALAQVGALMNDAWISGTADGSLELDGSGESIQDLLAHSDGQLKFTMRNGSLPHITFPGSAGPLPIHRFAGELRLKKGAWELSSGRLESRAGLYRINGTASPSNGMDFTLTNGSGQSWTLNGTLVKPRIALVGEGKAAAKIVP
jgi:hypothetical protein